MNWIKGREGVSLEKREDGVWKEIYTLKSSGEGLKSGKPSSRWKREIICDPSLQTLSYHCA